MIEEKFVKTVEELENLVAEYNLEDLGMSGQYPGFHWLQDDNAEVAVYYKPDLFE